MTVEGPRDCPPRFATSRTPERKTLGTAAAKVAEQLGTPLMPWQRQVLDTALEVEETKIPGCPVCVGDCVGHTMFVYKEVIITVPRQSGKTTMMLSLILTRALSQPNQRIVYTAQTRADARKKWFEEWIPVLDLSPFSDHYKTRLANGDEALIFENGSRQGLVASTAKAGHGQTLDLAMIDEAFSQPDARLEQALKPAMITRNQPPHHGAQLWVVSTAGTLTASPYLLQKVEAGREIAASGLNRQVAYFEWSAPDDADPSDVETWYKCMPALSRTANVEAVKADFLSMDLHEFQRAYLNQWTTISVDPVIPTEMWTKAPLQETDLDTTGVPVMIAIDVRPDTVGGQPRGASIAAAGRLSDGRIFVEVIKQQDGMQWVVPAIQQLVKTHDVRGLIVDAMGPAGSLVSELNKIHVNLKKVTAQELGQACQLLYDAAVDYKSVVHPGQQGVTYALDGAVKRPIGDGGWGWGRKNSGVDISPLVAITLAHWYCSTQGTSGASVWSLDEIVEEIRLRKIREAEERGEEPTSYALRRPEVPMSGGVTFTPL